MKAAVLVEQKKDLELMELAVPKPDVGQVLVRLKVSGICGSQIGEIDGVKGADPYVPHLLGHEAVGQVQAIGAGVSKVQVGDVVILHWRKGSGIEAPTPCYHHQDQKINAGRVTTFQEQTLVSENRVTKLPKGLDPEWGALLGCAMTTGLGAVCNDAKVKMGESVLVLGCGGVGLFEVLGSAWSSASPIVACDIHESKLDDAKKQGATHGLLSSAPDFQNKLNDIFGSKGPDVVFENTGRKELIELAYNVVSRSGRLILVGVPPENEVAAFKTLPLHFDLQVTGSHGGNTNPDVDIPRYAKLIQDKGLNINDFVSHRFSLDDVNEAIKTLRSGEAKRCLLVF